MTDLRFSHIGWAVHSIDKAARSFELLGFSPCNGICEDTFRGVRILLMKDSFGNAIELVEPAKDGSPVSNLLQKTGPAPYHVCFSASVRDYVSFAKKMQAEGFVELHKPEKAPALGGSDVAFLYSRDIGLVEVVLDTESGTKECAE